MSTSSRAQWISRASVLALVTGGVLSAQGQTFRVVAPDTVPPGNFSGVPDGCFLSPTGVTGPGEMVAGSSVPPTFLFPGESQAFVWTKATGAVGLGFLPGDIGSSAAAISHQGEVIVGTSYTPVGDGDLGTNDQAFVWTPAGGMVALGFLDPEQGAQSDAVAVSENGQVVVGSSTANGSSHGFAWTAAKGLVDLGSLEAGDFSAAEGVSADGAVIAGYAAPGPVGLQAFRWTAATGMTAVPLLPGDDNCVFATVSGNGKAIVGDSYDSTSSAGQHSFIWTKNNGVRDLGTLEVGSNMNTNGVSRDGAVVVGFCSGMAFRWTAKSGVESVRDILVRDKHLAKVLTGWSLTMATGVSPNGRKIVGIGVDPEGNQQGWVAEIPLD